MIPPDCFFAPPYSFSKTSDGSLILLLQPRKPVSSSPKLKLQKAVWADEDTLDAKPRSRGQEATKFPRFG